MATGIDRTALSEIACHYRSLGLKFRLRGLPYERCAELSWTVDYLKPRFDAPVRYLDIGTGESPLPSFFAAHTAWNITCLDKCPWVRKQTQFSKGLARKPMGVVEGDLLKPPLRAESFDVITCISVIEHFENNSDSMGMAAAARLLAPGGQLILTTLVNDRFFAEFYVRREVYGSPFADAPVFYQRHYDVNGLVERLVRPSGLLERQRVYFGDYDFQCFEKVLQQPRPVRALYAWNTPGLARRFLSYRSYPVSRKNMRMNTASGVIIVLEKSRAAETLN